MIDGERIQERMRVLGLSQSELARRAALTQSTIAKLIAGGRGSSHLHRIARELQTTPAYLTGETDDPDEGAPPPPPKPTAQVVSMQVLLPAEVALERMFLGILKACEGLSQDETARELAQLLPRGLALLQGPLVFEGTASGDDRPDDAEGGRSGRPARRRA